MRLEAADVSDLHRELVAAAGGRNVWVVGGGDVASQFADAGLLEKLLLTVVPVVLGRGKPLFARRLPGRPMQLLGARSFDTGMVELRAPAGRLAPRPEDGPPTPTSPRLRSSKAPRSSPSTAASSAAQASAGAACSTTDSQ